MIIAEWVKSCDKIKVTAFSGSGILNQIYPRKNRFSSKKKKKKSFGHLTKRYDIFIFSFHRKL